MITPEMIERAREKHYFQFYESGKNGTTFELGNPIYGTDCAIDTPISKDTWTPSKLADYIESQRKVPSKALDVKYCENMLRNICGEWKNFSEAYGTYDKEYLRKHPFHSCNELKNYVSSYQPEAISNIRKDYDIKFFHLPKNDEEAAQMFDTMIDKLSDKLGIQKEPDFDITQLADTLQKVIDAAKLPFDVNAADLEKSDFDPHLELFQRNDGVVFEIDPEVISVQDFSDAVLNIYDTYDANEEATYTIRGSSGDGDVEKVLESKQDVESSLHALVSITRYFDKHCDNSIEKLASYCKERERGFAEDNFVNAIGKAIKDAKESGEIPDKALKKLLEQEIKHAFGREAAR